jgi:hypothetical protein
VDRHLATLQHVDLARVHVQAHHVVAHLGQAGARDQADIARAPTTVIFIVSPEPGTRSGVRSIAGSRRV